MFTLEGTHTPVGVQHVTDLSAAVALTVPSGARYALASAVGQAVVFRADGVNPTASVGHPLPAGSSYWFTCELDQLRFIEASAGASLFVTYFIG